MRFDRRKVRSMLVEFRTVCFVHHKECRTLVVHWRGRFDYPKACRRFVEHWRVRFDLCKACRKLVELWSVRFDYPKRVAIL